MPRKNKYATPKERRKACRDGALKRWAGLKTPEERRAAMDAGELSHKTAAAIIKSWREHLRKTMLRIEDWQARLDALAVEHDKAVSAAE